MRWKGKNKIHLVELTIDIEGIQYQLSIEVNFPKQLKSVIGLQFEGSISLPVFL